MQFETYKEANKTGGNFYFQTKKVGEKDLQRQCSVDKMKPYDRFSDRTVRFKGSCWLTSPTPQRKTPLYSLPCPKFLYQYAKLVRFSCYSKVQKQVNIPTF